MNKVRQSPAPLDRLLALLLCAVFALSVGMPARALDGNQAIGVAKSLILQAPNSANSGIARRVINVGTRAGINGDSQSNGTNLQFNSVTTHYIPISASQIRLLYSGFFVSQGAAEADQTPDLTLKVGLRPAGAAPGTSSPNAVTLAVARRITFAASQTGTVCGVATSVSGSCTLISDPLPFYFPANQLIQVQDYGTLPSGQWWRTRAAVSGPGERNEEGVTVTDRSISGGETGTAAWSLAPNLILGVPDNPTARSVAFIGDSICAGTGDAADATTGVTGYLERGVGIAIPNAKFCRGGERLSHWASRDYSQIELVGKYFTDAVIELGINDIGNNATLSQMQGYVQGIATQLQAMGLRVYLCTLTPFTTSTDSWATLTNQTASADESVRTAYNDWVRTMPLGIAGYFDVADIAESGRNSGKWKVTGAANYATADGTHPSAAMHLLMSAAITHATFGYSALEDRRWMSMAANENTPKWIFRPAA